MGGKKGIWERELPIQSTAQCVQGNAAHFLWHWPRVSGRKQVKVRLERQAKVRLIEVWVKNSCARTSYPKFKFQLYQESAL